MWSEKGHSTEKTTIPCDALDHVFHRLEFTLSRRQNALERTQRIHTCIRESFSALRSVFASHLEKQIESRSRSCSSSVYAAIPSHEGGGRGAGVLGLSASCSTAASPPVCSSRSSLVGEMDLDKALWQEASCDGSGGAPAISSSSSSSSSCQKGKEGDVSGRLHFPAVKSVTTISTTAETATTGRQENPSLISEAFATYYDHMVAQWCKEVSSAVTSELKASSSQGEEEEHHTDSAANANANHHHHLVFSEKGNEEEGDNGTSASIPDRPRRLAQDVQNLWLTMRLCAARVAEHSQVFVQRSQAVQHRVEGYTQQLVRVEEAYHYLLQSVELATQLEVESLMSLQSEKAFNAQFQLPTTLHSIQAEETEKEKLVEKAKRTDQHSPLVGAPEPHDHHRSDPTPVVPEPERESEETLLRAVLQDIQKHHKKWEARKERAGEVKADLLFSTEKSVEEESGAERKEMENQSHASVATTSVDPAATATASMTDALHNFLCRLRAVLSPEQNQQQKKTEEEEESMSTTNGKGKGTATRTRPSHASSSDTSMKSGWCHPLSVGGVETGANEEAPSTSFDPHHQIRQQREVNATRLGLQRQRVLRMLQEEEHPHVLLGGSGGCGHSAATEFFELRKLSRVLLDHLPQWPDG